MWNDAFEQIDHGNFDPNEEFEFEPNLVFVGIRSAKEMDEVYSTIQKASKKLSLKATRVEESLVGSGFIIKEIADLIEKAEFLIFDLTYARPNVYYELGYAHGLGNRGEDILLIAGARSHIHFDVSPLRVFRYKSTNQLRDIVETALIKMMKKTRKNAKVTTIESSL